MATGDDTFTVSPSVQAKVKRFFEVYDPDRLLSNDFNVLLKYIANRGFPALEEKLLKKYGVNIASMEEAAADLPVDGEKELTELEDLPERHSPKRDGTRKQTPSMYLQASAGISPDGKLPEDPERARMFYRLTEFYKIHNQIKLRQGIGDVVEYALTKGEDRINEKLRKTYGQDLNTFETQQRMSRKYEQEQLGINKDTQDVDDGSRIRLRDELIQFFLVVEPARAELRMDPLLDYAERHGIDKLNAKLFDKYGYNLAKKPTSNAVAHHVAKPKPAERLDENLNSMKRGELPEYVKMMLSRYYAKYDQMMLEDGGVDAVYDWAKRNGLEKLNRKLAERYGQSLQEFIQLANDLRDDLIEFYRHRDKIKLVIGIQAILDWGLRNGRAALNEKLKSKYGVDLDVANELYDEVMESASQF